jgi:Mn-dependent DtxR family transcriptional regulator
MKFFLSLLFLLLILFACKNEVKPIAVTTPVSLTVVIDSIREHRTYNDSLFRVLQVEDSIAHTDSIKAANIADSLEFRRITKLINGGYNGFDDRWKLYKKAKEVLK